MIIYFQTNIQLSGKIFASDWQLQDAGGGLDQHIFPASMYDWSRPKQLWSSSNIEGEQTLIMYAKECSQNMLVGVDECNHDRPNSQVLTWLIALVSDWFLGFQWLIKENVIDKTSNQAKQFDWTYTIQPFEHTELYLNSNGQVRADSPSSYFKVVHSYYF